MYLNFFDDIFADINRRFDNNYDHTNIGTKRDPFREDQEWTSNEMTSLKRKNSHLNDALSWTIKQRDQERSEIGSLSKQLECVQLEKESVEDCLQGLTNVFFTQNLLIKLFVGEAQSSQVVSL